MTIMMFGFFIIELALLIHPNPSSSILIIGAYLIIGFSGLIIAGTSIEITDVIYEQLSGVQA